MSSESVVPGPGKYIELSPEVSQHPCMCQIETLRWVRTKPEMQESVQPTQDTTAHVWIQTCVMQDEDT